MTKLNEMALGKAGAVVSAACMLLLGLLGNLGWYMGGVNAMMQWHMFFSLGIVGILAGMIEAAVVGFVALYAFGWVYNKVQ